MEQLVDSYCGYRPARQLLETQNQKTVIRGIETVAWPQVFFQLVSLAVFLEKGVQLPSKKNVSWHTL